jgi:hypothetical protein
LKVVVPHVIAKAGAKSSRRRGPAKTWMTSQLGLVACLRIRLRWISAWFEAFVGGRWHTFDARHNITRIGHILIARGRDAADVAISTTFGQTSLKSFVVTTGEVEQEVSNNWVEGGIGSEALMNCLHVRHGSRLAD